jgi:hypothetical protein
LPPGWGAWQSQQGAGQNRTLDLGPHEYNRDAAIPTAGVKVPNAGVRIQVLKQDGTSMRIRVSSTKQ